MLVLVLLTWLFFILSSCWKDMYWMCHESSFVLFCFLNVCKICKCCKGPYLLCNYPARAVLGLLATFFNYCNSLLVGFPDSGRCSCTVSKCNGQPLSQYKALLRSWCWNLRPHHGACPEDFLLGCGWEDLGLNSCPQKGSQICLEKFPLHEMGNVGICSKHSSQSTAWPNIPVPSFLLLCDMGHTIYLLL